MIVYCVILVYKYLRQSGGKVSPYTMPGKFRGE